ncbi:unnamed protein product [Musa textilis]
MLNSLKNDGGGAQDTLLHPDPHHPNPQPDLISSTVNARQLLISCAELVHCGDLPAAERAISILAAAASPYGDSIDRLIRQFCRALSVRIGRVSPSAASSGSLQSSYLLFNQMTPFLRFSHLTANQAILEAVMANATSTSSTSTPTTACSGRPSSRPSPTALTLVILPSSVSLAPEAASKPSNAPVTGFEISLAL